MLFDVYGPNAGFQWLGLAMVLIALILLNEFARRTKAGGMLHVLRRLRRHDRLLPRRGDRRGGRRRMGA